MSNNVYILFTMIEGKVAIAGVYEEPSDAEDREDEILVEYQDDQDYLNETWIECHTLNMDNDIG